MGEVMLRESAELLRSRGGVRADDDDVVDEFEV